MDNIKELSRREEVTVKTLVEFTFKDGSKKEIEVNHFSPRNEDEIKLGLENRLISEQREIDEAKVEPLEEVKE